MASTRPGFEVLEAIAATLSDDIWVVVPADETILYGPFSHTHRPVAAA